MLFFWELHKQINPGWKLLNEEKTQKLLKDSTLELPKNSCEASVMGWMFAIQCKCLSYWVVLIASLIWSKISPFLSNMDSMWHFTKQICPALRVDPITLWLRPLCLLPIWELRIKSNQELSCSNTTLSLAANLKHLTQKTELLGSVIYS